MQLTPASLSPAIMRPMREANSLFQHTVKVSSAVLPVVSLYLHDMHRDNLVLPCSYVIGNTTRLILLSYPYIVMWKLIPKFEY